MNEAMLNNMDVDELISFAEFSGELDTSPLLKALCRCIDEETRYTEEDLDEAVDEKDRQIGALQDILSDYKARIDELEAML